MNKEKIIILLWQWNGKYLVIKNFNTRALWQAKWTFLSLKLYFYPRRYMHTFFRAFASALRSPPHCAAKSCLPSNSGKMALLSSLKSPTNTSQDKAETGNTWQTTWGQCGVVARVIEGVAARHGVTIATSLCSSHIMHLLLAERETCILLLLINYLILLQDPSACFSLWMNKYHVKSLPITFASFCSHP